MDTRHLAAAPRPTTVTDSDRTIRRRERISRRLLVASDLIVAPIAALAAINLLARDNVRIAFLLIGPLAVVIAKTQGLYDRDELVIRKTTLRELPRLVHGATVLVLVFWLARHLVVQGAPNSWTLLGLWVETLALVVLGRTVARAFATRITPRERCFFLGDVATARLLGAKLANSRTAELIGVAPADHAELDEEMLRELVERFDVHRLVISFGDDFSDGPLELVRAAEEVGVRVSICPGSFGVVGSAAMFDDVWGMPLLGVPRFGLTRSSLALKRAFDLIAATAGVVVLLPVMAVVAVLIKRGSPGPVFFRQPRVGRNGRTFQILKFRSMVDGADAMKAGLGARNEADGLFKIGDDPRVTAVGHWLRKTSLDEIPQLLNVIAGQMSLVGPRPLVLDEDRQITGYDRRRLKITPGMTGHWQILGSARIPLHEMIKLDYAYVANWSLWTDVEILVRTVGYVMAGRGV
jgi:exopolysaccharide biosynthesis polyprenyl glycosylphosphotransferase